MGAIKGRIARGKSEREGGETPRARHKPKRIGRYGNALGFALRVAGQGHSSGAVCAQQVFNDRA